mmetsp:Transcript_29094/g.46304  ORF Transcript_29094/g.46304 Transcript_29094/m.46304 type:complete len:247 (+) Transcript_29094:46-786(+)
MSGRKSDCCVKVNVGGTIFEASPATLRKSTFFDSLLGDELSDDLKDSEGHLFIDRDPILFDQVLRILRGYIPQTSRDVSWAMVKEEADFYSIPIDLLKAPVEVVLPPDILVVRRLYAENETPCPEHLARDEICMYSMTDLPPDLKSQTRIIAVEVIRHQCGSKTMFVISQRVLEEAGFLERASGTWERTERRCYHTLKDGTQLLIPEHPMEVLRESTDHYVCVTYAVPPVSIPVIAGESVVAVRRN